MNHKSHFKNPDDLKIEIEKLVSFQENEDPLKPPLRAKDENPDNRGLPSKYRKVLTCSFVNRTTNTTSTKRIGAGKD